MELTWYLEVQRGFSCIPTAVRFILIPACTADEYQVCMMHDTAASEVAVDLDSTSTRRAAMLWYRHQTGLLFPVTFGSGIILCWHTGTTVVHRTRPPPLGHPYSLCCKHTETFLIATTVSRYQDMKAPCPAVSKLQKATISFDDDVLTLSIIAHFPEV